jgi:hypothetical protein
MVSISIVKDDVIIFANGIDSRGINAARRAGSMTSSRWAAVRMLQFPTRFRVSEEQSLSQIPVSAESLAFALESTLKYTFHLLNEFAPEMVRRHVAVNVSAMRYGEYYRVILPNLQEVLAILRQLLN